MTLSIIYNLLMNIVESHKPVINANFFQLHTILKFKTKQYGYSRTEAITDKMYVWGLFFNKCLKFNFFVFFFLSFKDD